MKIVQALGWYFPESVGGTETYVSALVDRFAERGHHTLIAAPEPGARAPRTYMHGGHEVFRYPIGTSPTREEAQGRVASAGAEYLHEWLRAVRADVVHVHTFVTGLGVHELAAARDAGRRVVATTHSSSLGFVCQRGTLMWRGETICDGIVELDRCAACELEHRGLPAIAAAALARVPATVGAWARDVNGRAATGLAMTDLIAWNRTRQRQMLALVDAFVVLTQRAADIVLANGAEPRKVVVNRLGVHRAFNRQPVGSRARSTTVRFGYVGRFDEIKGVVDLAEAIRRVPADVDAEFEFVGPAQTRGACSTRALIAELASIDPRVVVRDGVTPGQVPDLLRRYDVVCCPSRCLEGGPTVALEAMAVGTPVVVANVGGAAELLNDGVNSRLVSPGDVDQLTAALIDIAHDRAATVDCWQHRLPPIRSMDDVADDYLAMYGAAE